MTMVNCYGHHIVLQMVRDITSRSIFMFDFSSSSGSMEPAFQRGDLLFLTNFKEDPIRVGEIVVFKVKGREIPIVHRVIKLHEK